MTEPASVAASAVSGSPVRSRFSHGVHPNELGLWFFLGTAGMLFAAFVSALLVRRTGADWSAVEFPALLWWNSALLLASSATLELSRRTESAVAWRWLAVTLALGVTFVAGQLVVWRELASQGISLGSGPHPAFLYILTGAHALHVAGGLVLLAWTLRIVTRTPEGRRPRRLLRMSAAYWHFLALAWVVLFAVLATA